MTSETNLKGLHILVVEDETMISMMIEDMLIDLGATVVGPAGNVAQALAVIEAGGRIDGALLDVNLSGEKSFAVADALALRGVPFVFATGYGEVGVRSRYPDAPTIQKPFPLADLTRALERATAAT
jgi:CheY-like chemotaxis protein